MKLSLIPFFLFNYSLLLIGLVSFAVAAPYIPHVPESFYHPDPQLNRTVNAGEYDDHCTRPVNGCFPGSHGPHNVNCHEKGGMMPSKEMRNWADALKTLEPDKTYGVGHKQVRTMFKTYGGLVKLCVFNRDEHKDTAISNKLAGEALWSIENACCYQEDGIFCRGGKTTAAHSVDGLDIEIVAINVGEECRDLADRSQFEDEKDTILP
ncbi:MAG: hypothetical protein L6R36_007929 [Xanthoria steineri]|nr:MAG: hypothetical protein L6R36_007929 [Xanthoria steineri]